MKAGIDDARIGTDAVGVGEAGVVDEPAHLRRELVHLVQLACGLQFGK